MLSILCILSCMSVSLTFINNVSGGAEQEAWEYMAVCVPIVVFFAPMGSLIASHFHRQGTKSTYTDLENVDIYNQV